MATHIKHLPPDSAFIRKEMKAPMGWDNSTEMLATIVDSIHVLIRLTQNINSKSPDKSEIPRVKRPFETSAPPIEKTVSLAEALSALAKGG